MVVTEAIAGLGAIKTAFDMAKALESIHEAVARDRAVIDLQKEILTAQQAQFSLVERVRDLEKQLTAFENWEAEKQRYELKALAPGLVALALKPAMSNGELFHYICANCCAAGKKSYLQQHISGPYYDEFRCRGCGDEIPINKGTPPSSYIQPTDF